MSLENLLEKSLTPAAVGAYLLVTGVCSYRLVEYASTGDYKRAAAAGVLSAISAYCTLRRAML